MSRQTLETAWGPSGAETGVQTTVRLCGFAAEAIAEEAARLGISSDELVSFSVLYYLADADSGRIARRIDKSPLLGSDLPSAPAERYSAASSLCQDGSSGRS
jgi:hypothetical protein